MNQYIKNKLEFNGTPETLNPLAEKLKSEGGKDPLSFNKIIPLNNESEVEEKWGIPSGPEEMDWVLYHNQTILNYEFYTNDNIPLPIFEKLAETYPEYDMNLHQGETVTLMGDKAYWYVRLRDENLFDSNSMRLERQKQYLTSFIAKAKETAGGDISVAIDLFNIMQKYMVTDLNVSSYTYLATETMDYEFDVENMYSIEGETVQGNEFEEFYVDDDALQALIIKLFYEPVK